MLNFPKNQFIVRNKKEREEIDYACDILRRNFQGRLLKSRIGVKDEVIAYITDSNFPISQKHSYYSDLPYGQKGTIGSGGCGPLAVEYALRLMGFEVFFLDIIEECVNKGYRAYEYNEKGEITTAAGTEDHLFYNLADEALSLSEIFEALKEGRPVTLLVDNTIYNRDSSRKGNHFVTLIGVGIGNNAIIMDGNKIVNCQEEAKVVIPLDEILIGTKGAWIWDKEKVKSYL